MMSRPLPVILLTLYLALFFGYLLSPLIIMGITAFNSSGFPRAAPWECLTFEWFDVLAGDKRITDSILNSIVVGAFTVVISVALGLAGALLLTQIWPRMRATYYTVVIAPILIPGVVLGISTLVFWGRINSYLGFADDGFLRNGIFLTVLGQSTFIAAYCMLVFIARLQRFDSGLTEAALDLGATHTQAFRKILLPFLKPAFASAAVIAFLASFENYNTTTFTFGTYPTLTIELAQKVRYGINPSISALAVIIVVLTIMGALLNEAYKRRQKIKAGARVGEMIKPPKLPGFLARNPAAIVLTLLVLGIVATVTYAQQYSPAQCKLEVQEQKRLEADERRQEMLRALDERRGAASGGQQSPAPGAPANPNAGAFGNVFNPDNLDGAGEPAPAAPGDSNADNPNAGAFGGVFNPSNLDGATEETPSASEGTNADNPNTGAFGDVFNPGNLATPEAEETAPQQD
ncbi:MAG: hypothetical protein Kilf2KO_06190 [Rhodospirillales bacterium]